VYQVINRFCAVNLSALYVDVLKDRLYCNAKSDTTRLAAQTVMSLVLEGLIKMLAPIVPFTAEEAWQFGKQKGSIHSQYLPKETGKATWNQSNPWNVRLALRSKVNEKLEQARREKQIGKSLEARVEIRRHPDPHIAVNLFSNLETPLLEELFIVSKVIIKPTEGEEIITVTRAEDHGMKKCVRCWKYYDTLGSHAEHPELCDRCTDVVVGLGL
jgi:isoleucyl-tRNA synthetase